MTVIRASVRPRLALVIALLGALLAGGSMLRGDQSVKAEPARKKTAPLEGAWRKFGVRNPDTGKIERVQDGGGETIKMITGGRWSWTHTQGDRAVAGLGGTYTLKDDEYTETVEYSIGPGFEAHIGRPFTYTVKFDGDKFSMTGTIEVRGMRFTIDEVWERVAAR
jgi:hypothetical protein